MNIKTHLKHRHLDLELHRPILDEELNIATFLLYNLSGQLVGYQQYNPLGDKKSSIPNLKENIILTETKTNQPLQSGDLKVITFLMVLSF